MSVLIKADTYSIGTATSTILTEEGTSDSFNIYLELGEDGNGKHHVKILLSLLQGEDYTPQKAAKLKRRWDEFMESHSEMSE